MWARHLELCLGLWLVMSPFVFGHVEDGGALAVDLACGGALVVLPLLTYWRPLRRVHLLELLVAAYLFASGWIATRQGETPESQNHLTVALLVMMLAIVPSDASRPPEAWREGV